jgi:hypothetical protein
MRVDKIPIELLLVITILLVVLSIEAGYRAGKVLQSKHKEEKESPVSSISGYILGLLAFIIAFTFSIVTDRFETRKELVREEANLIRTAWMRADFLPDTQRAETKSLLREYTGLRLTAVKSNDLDQVKEAMSRSGVILQRLWSIATANAGRDMNSDVAALYIESINDVANINASRVVIGLHTRIPEGIWKVVLALVLLGMFSVGYQTAIAGSSRSWTGIILAVSFSIVIVLIEALDRPQTHLIPVSQFPIEYLQTAMDEELQAK